MQGKGIGRCDVCCAGRGSDRNRGAVRGYPFSNTDIEDALPDGVTLLDGYSVSGSRASASQDEVDEWISLMELE